MPKVSVIIPFFNAEASLDQACRSVYDQTLKDFECILINNNSADKSTEIAQKWIQKDNRFKLIHETRQGVAYASEKGSKKALANYIARMDADDIMICDRLEKQHNYLENNPEYGAVGGLVKFGGNPKEAAGIKRFVDWNNQLQTYEQILLYQFAELPIINPTLMWRKHIEKKHGGYTQGDFPEDFEMILRWLSQSVKIGKVNNEVLIWNDPPNRLTRTDERYSFNAFYKTKANYLNQWLKTHNPHYPNVYVWGASRIARKRAKHLQNQNIKILGYIDISTKRDIGENLIHYEKIPSAKEAFILIYTPQENIKNQILDYLISKNYINGVHFLFVA
jgi:glycosyltransferase involved in cell wall biosynthesis